MLVAVAGYGRRGEYWARLLTRTREHSIAAIVDPDAARRQLAHQAFPQAIVCVPDDLPHCAANMAVVSSPTRTHAAVAARLAGRIEGVRLLVEKPVGDVRDSLETILSLPVPKWSGYLERLNYAFMRSLATAKAIHLAGDPVEVFIDRVRPSPNGEVDALIDLMSHDFHALALADLLDRAPTNLQVVRRSPGECLIECNGENLRITLRAAYGPPTTRVRISANRALVHELTQDQPRLAAVRPRSVSALVEEIREGKRQSEMASERRCLALVHDCIAVANHCHPINGR